jgi:uncharacterized membrane protein YhfC
VLIGVGIRCVKNMRRKFEINLKVQFAIGVVYFFLVFVCVSCIVDIQTYTRLLQG